MSQTSKELQAAIRSWWRGLKAYHGVSDEDLAGLVEATARRRAGRGFVQPVDRKNISAWRTRGQFPPGDEFLQDATVELMAQMAKQAGVPEEVGAWGDVERLYRAWLDSRAKLAEEPSAKTVQANARKTQQLADVLVGQPDQVVADAVTSVGLRDGFWQGSWVMDGDVPPYVPRTIDGLLDEQLQRLAGAGQGGLLVVVGPPKAGKTRSLLEALGRVVPDRLLWHLRPLGGALDAVVEAVASDGGRMGPFDPKQVVVLLDDLQRHGFHTAGGVNDKTLKRVLDQGVLVVATLHQETLARMRMFALDHTRGLFGAEPAAQATPGLVDLLQTNSIELDAALGDDELANIPEALRNLETYEEATAAQLMRLPEWLAATDALAARGQAGQHDLDHPERAALIDACLHTSSLLPAGADLALWEQLTAFEFQQMFPTRHWHPELFLKAFEWATTPIGGAGSVHAILRPATPGSDKYQLFDPLTGRLEPARAFDPVELLGFVEHFDPDQRFSTALEFADRMTLEHHIAWAEGTAPPLPFQVIGLKFFTHIGVPPEFTAYWLGRIEEEVQETGYRSYLDPWMWATLFDSIAMPHEAIRWYLRAGEIGPFWAHSLARASDIYAQLGEHDAALEWALKAARSNSDEALLTLATRYLEVGDEVSAERWFAELAGTRFAEREYLRGSGPGTSSRGADSAEFTARSSPDALSETASHEASRKDSLRQAVRLGHPEAMLVQAALDKAEGNLEEAEHLRNRVANPVGWVDLLGRGSMYLARGDRKEARRWFQVAAEQGWAGATYLLGTLVQESEAEPLWRQAAEAGSRKAMRALAKLHLKRGELELAEVWFVQAAEEYDLVSIRHLIDTVKDPDQLEYWLTKAVECFDRGAMESLASRHWARGESEQAVRLWEKASPRSTRAVLSRAMAFQEDEADQLDAWLERNTLGNELEIRAYRGLMAWLVDDKRAAWEWWKPLTELDCGDTTGPKLTISIGLEDVAPELSEMWRLAAEGDQAQDALSLEALTQLPPPRTGYGNESLDPGPRIG